MRRSRFRFHVQTATLKDISAAMDARPFAIFNASSIMILPSSVICDGWFFVRFPAYASGGRNLFPTVRPMEVAVDSRIRVTRESAEYFRVRLLGFYGPHAHLDVIIPAADLRQWRDKIDEALQEVDNVGV